MAKIGVGITVQNRFEVTDKTVSKWKSLLPRGAVLVIVDDGSAVPYPQATFRFEQPVGIPRAKNKCFELLEDAGVEEFFLADSDLYPTSRGWHKPYIESPEPHLSYQFLDLLTFTKLNDMKILYRDKKHIAYTGQRGCMLYYNKTVLERVGGFDPIYGRGLYEHGDLANRIHEAGLTTWRYADVTGSNRLWHSMDEHVEVARTIEQETQRHLVRQNVRVHNSRRAMGYQGFVPYREKERGDRDILITTLLTKNVDPQRGYKWNADPVVLTPWLESVERGGWEGVVLADEVRKLPRGYSSTLTKVEPSRMNVYYQRWLHILHYLRDHPEVRWVWCTDGTDVEVLRDPFEDMSTAVLYAGCEDSQVSNYWMKNNHRAAKFSGLFKRHETDTLLNAGVVGGSREIIHEFAQKMVSLYFDIEMDRFHKVELPGREVGDMAAFNYVAYEHFGSRLSFGPHITTEFKAYEDNGTAKFKHK